jgi:1-phosphofructokinase
VIVTVTPNPSIDRTLEIDRLERGGLIRAKRSTAEAAGKGVNVSCALTTQGVATVAALPLAEDSAATYLGLLAGATPIAPVPIAGSIRINVSLVEADGTVTKVNEPGPALGAGDVEALLSAAEKVPDAAWILGCGSLPPGAPGDFYARLAALGSPDRRVAIDAISTVGDVVTAARELVARGCTSVLVSLGADGAVYVDADVASHAEASIDDVVNTVGAGDALLAGFVAAGGGIAGLPTAIAWSVAAVRSPGTRMCPVTAADRAAVVVHQELNRARRLQA